MNDPHVDRSARNLQVGSQEVKVWRFHFQTVIGAIIRAQPVLCGKRKICRKRQVMRGETYE